MMNSLELMQNGQLLTMVIIFPLAIDIKTNMWLTSKQEMDKIRTNRSNFKSAAILLT